MPYLVGVPKGNCGAEINGAVLTNLDYPDMNTKLFIGNLSYKVTEQELEKLFSQVGTVVSVAIPVDRTSGNKRGFAFVEMQTQAEAEAAVKQFHGQTVEGRQIAVNPSQPRESGPRRNNRR
jgi:RNA recognition motif-containing protein